MTLGAQNADDSCHLNQTVPEEGGVSSSSPAHIESNNNNNDIINHHDENDDNTTTTVIHEKKNDLNHDNNGGDRDEKQQQHEHEHDLPPSASALATTPFPAAVPPLTENRSRSSSSSSPPPPSQQEEEEDTFPEGGLPAWLVVLGSFSAMLSVYGLINSAAVFESYFSTHQLSGYPASSIGWIFSVYLFVVFFVGIQVGPLFDLHGPRWLVVVGSVLVVASQMILGSCTKYWEILLTYSVLGGLGGALLNVPSYGVIAHFFKIKRGMATGVATTAGSVGGIIFPFMFQGLFPRLGFAWGVRISGFLLLFLAVPANLLIRSRLPPPSKKENKKHSVWPDWSLFKDLRFTFCCAGVWFMEWGIFTPLSFIVSYAAAHSDSSSSSGGGGGHGQQESDTTAQYTLLALLNVGSFFGRFLPGMAADRWGRFNVIVGTNFLCAATILGLWLPAGSPNISSETRDALLIAFVVLFGFASGSNLGLYPVCIGQLCDSRDYGRFYSTALMVGSFGTLTSVPIGGALLGLGGGGGDGYGGGETGWNALIIFAALSYIIAMSFFLGARVLAVSWRVKEVF